MLNSVRKGMKNLKKAFLEAGTKLLSTVGNHEYKRFIVLSRSRTGSNLLISLLDSHSQIHVKGEKFVRLRGRDHKKILANLFSKQPHFLKAKGFKIFYEHPLDDDSCSIWEDLQSMEDLYVIHLKRKNILRTLLSRKIAGIQNVWAVTPNEKSHSCQEQVTVSFTVDELNAGFRQTREWEEMGDASFSRHPLLSIDYEELVADRATTLRKVTQFLGVEYRSPKTELLKQSCGSMREQISNYDELKSAFAETEWGHFFED